MASKTAAPAAEAKSTLPAETTENLEATITSAVAIVDAYVIDSPEIAELAAEDLRKLQTEYKRVEEMRFAITRPMDAAKAAAIAAFKPYLDKIDAARTALGAKVNAYLTAERDRVAAEERKRREEQEAEERRLAEERAKVTAEAEAAADAGDDAAFEAAAQKLEDIDLEANISASTTLPAVAAQKLAGVSQRQLWKIKSIDLGELVKAAAADPTLLQYLHADEVAIGKMVRAAGNGHRIPGVTAVREASLSTRRF